MVAFTIHNIGLFMSKLLSTDCFDSFLLEEAVIRMAVTYTIDGHLNRNFYESDVWDDPAQRPFIMQPWSEARGICREMIRGKKAPASLRITLQLKPEPMAKTLAGDKDLLPGTVDAVGALAVNIRLDDTGLRLITGVSWKSFSMDREPERIWDRTMDRFLAAKGIECTREDNA